MPFVTEELWQSLPWRSVASHGTRKQLGLPDVSSLMLQPFPEFRQDLVSEDAEQVISSIQTIVESFRNFRGENNISPKVEFPVRYCPGSIAADSFLKAHSAQIRFMSRIGDLVALPGGASEESGESMIRISHPPLELRIQLQGLVNVDEEVKRVEKEIEKLNADLAFLSGKLSQETFLSRAPAALVEKERVRQGELMSKKIEMEKVLIRLQSLK
jgi:valyl-tRNA synthetase